MRKGLSILLAVALLGVFAVPAMAEFNFSGFVRDKYFVSNYERYDAGQMIPYKSTTNATAEGSFPNFGSTALNKENFYSSGVFAVPAPLQARVLVINTKAPTAAYFEQRARLKFEAKTDVVGAVAFFEYDLRFGDASYVVGRNVGGGLESDTINQETKNLYLWFKPTPASAINVGLQNFTDSYRGVLLGYADIAGVSGTWKIDPVDLRFVYGIIKHDKTASIVPSTTDNSATIPLVSTSGLVAKNASSDTEFWALEAHASPIKDLRAGLNVYLFNDTGAFSGAPKVNGTFTGVGTSATFDSAHIWTIGADASFKVIDPLTLSAFAFFQTGSAKNLDASGQDLDFRGYAGDIRADVAAGPGKGFLEVIYISGDDGSDVNKTKAIATGSNFALAGSFYTTTDMEILLPNIDDTNTSQALTYDAANLGQGLLHIGAGYTMPIPGMDKLSFKVGAGHSRFTKASTDTLFHEKTQGTEVNARVNYNMAKGLDLNLIGAYAWLGNAYKKNGNALMDDSFRPSSVDDPDNLYKIVARVNYAF